MKTWFSIKNIAADTAEVRMYGRIGGDYQGGVDAARFCEQFNAIKAAKIDLRINSAGGDIAAASCICTAINEHTAEVTAHVDGLAASCASWIAVSCDSVQMSKTAMMMIHDPMAMAFGTADDMRKEAAILDKTQGMIAQLYADKSGKSKEDVIKAMNEETWFDAADAKAWGLCDAIKDDPDEEEEDEEAYSDSAINELAPLLLMKFKNVPERVKRLAAMNTCGGHMREQTPTSSQKEPNMLKIVNRDGKNFVTLDGKEHEVQVVAPTGTNSVVEVLKGKSEEEVAAAVNLAKAEAIKVERAYRDMFDTVIASANLAGNEARAEFRKDFYGLDEKQLKFLASRSIGNRAKPIGEGSGDKEGDAPNPIAVECAKRFSNEAGLRQMWGVHSADTTNEQYKKGLARFIERSLTYEQDAKPEAQREKSLAARAV